MWWPQQRLLTSKPNWSKCRGCFLPIVSEFCLHTVWKFKDFSISRILREINFEDSWSAKSAILPHLEALNFGYYLFLHFLKGEIDQINKNQKPKICKKGSFSLQESSKLISRKIWVIEKSWNFHTVISTQANLQFSFCVTQILCEIKLGNL